MILPVMVCGSFSMKATSRGYSWAARRFDREWVDLPATYKGTLREHLWQAFKSSAHMPVSQRHLRSLLAWVTKPGNSYRFGLPATDRRILLDS
jgi:hypothetical protein